MCICSFLHSCIAHVENVAQDFVAAEVEEEGAEGQEELYQELEVAEPIEEQFSVSDLANSESQLGKPRFINPSVLHNFKLYAI